MKDCPSCGTNRVNDSVERCEVCETADKYEAKIQALEARIEELSGIRPEFPPRPPEGEGLPRYGLRWNGPNQPVTVPMDDGYWTPFHLAAKIQAREAKLRDMLETVHYSMKMGNNPSGPVLQQWLERIEDALSGHTWFEHDGKTACKECGVVQRADKMNKPCKGPVKVETR